MTRSLVFSGFNALLKREDKFSIEFPFDTLNGFYTSFDTILHLKSEANTLPVLFYIDLKTTKKFIKLELDELELNEYTKIKLCSNMDSFWLLNNKPSIINFTFNKIIRKFDLNEYNENFEIFSTDLMVYVINKSTNEVVFQIENNNDHDNGFKLPNQLDIKEKIEKICCSKEHILFLTAAGRSVYSFGIGTRGQLGHGTIDNYNEPKRIEDLHDIKEIATGGWHSALIDNCSTVSTWGWNLNGQLGVGADDSDDEDAETVIPIPSSIDILNDHHLYAKLAKISLGSRHTTLVDETGNLYTFGWNKYKQLFISDADDSFKPKLIQEFKNTVLDVKCGPWYTLILISQ